MSKNPSPRGRHHQLGTVNEDPEFQVLHRRQDRWQPQVHETLLAATPSLLPPSSSSPCRRSTICTSRSSAIDPVQPLTAYAGTINEETDWTATSCSFHSPVTFSSRSVWTRSLRGSPMLTPSALVVLGSYTRHARSTSPSTPITTTSSPTALRASRTRSWIYARRRARLRQAIQKPASASTRSVTGLCYLRPYRLRRDSKAAFTR